MRASNGVGSGICILGRTQFGTGIGLITEAWADLLARRYDVEIWDLHSSNDGADHVSLTNGRLVPLARSLDGYAAYVYADVLWNGYGLDTYVPPPASGYRIAYLAFDSDELPPEWVTILNRDFDAVYFSSAHLIRVAERSGVSIPVGSIPLALDTEREIARPYRPVSRRVRFGTLSAYHPRKGLDQIVGAFLREFGDADDVELVIHSNLAIGETAARVAALVAGSGTDRIRLSTSSLGADEKNELLEGFDIYVNASQGEGYSIGPREALAMGKPLVLSDVGSHAPLFAAPGTFRVSISHRAPAIYPEIDGRQFGLQEVPDDEHLRRALREAYEFVRSPMAEATAFERKMLASAFTRQALERTFWAALDPDSAALRPGMSPHPQATIPSTTATRARSAAGRHGGRLGARKIVVPAHDGGFFSLFNTYVSEVVWADRDSPQSIVLPDWRAERLLERIAPKMPVSFCYSRPGEGNLWNHLFEAPYDVSPGELDDAAFLTDSARLPWYEHNTSREPLLTYIHAFRLYHSPDFARIRRQYHGVLRDHVRLLPHYRKQLDDFLAANREGRFLVAAHVKHPSHAIEQPDGSIADRHVYVDLVRRAVAERGIAESSDDWAVFLATEQERVVDLFRREFGDHVLQFQDVERIPVATDVRFDSLPESEKTQDGHQLQHILATQVERWSPRLAWEVIRDAHVMATSDVLFHAVSNVATAAAFLGPDVDMRFAATD
jgi:glycosyltransferase involved in cell wall biosynthesis